MFPPAPPSTRELLRATRQPVPAPAPRPAPAAEPVALYLTPALWEREVLGAPPAHPPVDMATSRADELLRQRQASPRL